MESTALQHLPQGLGPEATFWSSNPRIYAMIAGHTLCVFPLCSQEVLR